MEHCSVTLNSGLSKAELQALSELLTSSNLFGAHLRIGTAAGGTLAEMMKCYAHPNRPAFYSVDLMKYFPGQKETIEKNISLNPQLEQITSCYQLGLSDQNGTLYWEEESHNPGNIYESNSDAVAIHQSKVYALPERH